MGAKGAGKKGGKKGGREERGGVGCWVVCVVCDIGWCVLCAWYWVVCVVCVVLGGKECCNAHVCGIRSVATRMCVV